MPTKVCRKCNTEKDLTEFYVKSNTTYCKQCIKVVNKGWELKNKDRVREYRTEWHRQQRKKKPGCFLIYERRKTLKKFGKTVEWFDQTLKDQNGGCAICESPETGMHQCGRVASLAIDHNHETGKVRGLLCRLCNHALHKLDKDHSWAMKALAYLQKHDKETNGNQGTA